MVRQIKKFQIGKKGLTSEFIEQVRNYFENSEAELIKVEILKSACRDKKEAKKMAEELVDQLGKNFNYRSIGANRIRAYD